MKRAPICCKKCIPTVLTGMQAAFGCVRGHSAPWKVVAILAPGKAFIRRHSELGNRNMKNIPDATAKTKQVPTPSREMKHLRFLIDKNPANRQQLLGEITRPINRNVPVLYRGGMHSHIIARKAVGGIGDFSHGIVRLDGAWLESER